MPAVLMSLFAAVALSQAGIDAGMPVAPVPAEPDNTQPDVARTSGLEDAGTTKPTPGAEAVEAVSGASPGEITDAGVPVTTASITDDIEGKISAALRLSETVVSGIAIDDLGYKVAPKAFQTRLRVAPEVHFKGFGALAEFDAATGAIYGNPDQTILADRVPVPNFQPIELRQLYLEYKWQSGIFRLGQQTQNFGLGMLSNSGSADAAAGDFGQQHFGAIVYRALLAGRPFYSLGGNWRALEGVVAADLVWRDNNADFNLGDRTFQVVGAVRVKADDERFAGFTFVYRRQRAINADDGGRQTDAFVIDFAGKWAFMRREDRALSLGLEMVGILGTTTQTRTDVAPVSQVRQFGAAAKVNYRYKSLGLLLDWGYASGDQNPYDDKIEGFRFDRDYKVGLVLFDQVLGYQSARAGFRAADPQLTGQPPEGVQLLPTGGSVYNAWFLFPRVRYGFTSWLDVYGGPLFAFSTAALTDAFSTKVKGGTPHNYLGATPGSYLGTELDLGVQARWQPHRLLNITATLEGGLFLPGDAFRQVDGTTMGPVGLGRLRLQLAL
ncbi:MAG: hypothetical protein JNK82_39515 [Myxococcaceae bacterium]|nr:hypothetical protein [Myxococcaceae bacterium]